MENDMPEEAQMRDAEPMEEGPSRDRADEINNGHATTPSEERSIPEEQGKMQLRDRSSARNTENVKRTRSTRRIWEEAMPAGHIVKSSASVHTCPLCGSVRTGQSSLWQHLSSVHNAKMTEVGRWVHCGSCDTNFSHDATWRLHLVKTGCPSSAMSIRWREQKKEEGDDSDEDESALAGLDGRSKPMKDLKKRKRGNADEEEVEKKRTPFIRPYMRPREGSVIVRQTTNFRCSICGELDFPTISSLIYHQLHQHGMQLSQVQHWIRCTGCNQDGSSLSWIRSHVLEAGDAAKAAGTTPTCSWATANLCWQVPHDSDEASRFLSGLDPVLPSSSAPRASSSNSGIKDELLDEDEMYGANAASEPSRKRKKHNQRVDKSYIAPREGYVIVKRKTDLVCQICMEGGFVTCSSIDHHLRKKHKVGVHQAGMWMHCERCVQDFCNISSVRSHVINDDDPEECGWKDIFMCWHEPAMRKEVDGVKLEQLEDGMDLGQPSTSAPKRHRKLFKPPTQADEGFVIVRRATDLPCFGCNFRCPSLTTFISHMPSKHRLYFSDVGAWMECACGREFTSTTALRTHIREDGAETGCTMQLAFLCWQHREGGAETETPCFAGVDRPWIRSWRDTDSGSRDLGPGPGGLRLDPDYWTTDGGELSEGYYIVNGVKGQFDDGTESDEQQIKEEVLDEMEDVKFDPDDLIARPQQVLPRPPPNAALPRHHASTTPSTLPRPSSDVSRRDLPQRAFPPHTASSRSTTLLSSAVRRPPRDLPQRELPRPPGDAPPRRDLLLRDLPQKDLPRRSSSGSVTLRPNPAPRMLANKTSERREEAIIQDYQAKRAHEMAASFILTKRFYNLPCFGCNRRFETLEECTSHMKDKHGLHHWDFGGWMECACKRPFHSETALKVHIQQEGAKTGCTLNTVSLCWKHRPNCETETPCFSRGAPTPKQFGIPVNNKKKELRIVPNQPHLLLPRPVIPTTSAPNGTTVFRKVPEPRVVSNGASSSSNLFKSTSSSLPSTSNQLFKEAVKEVKAEELDGMVADPNLFAKGSSDVIYDPSNGIVKEEEDLDSSNYDSIDVASSGVSGTSHVEDVEPAEFKEAKRLATFDPTGYDDGDRFVLRKTADIGCRICKKMLSTPTALATHLKTFHGAEMQGLKRDWQEQQWLECAACSSVFHAADDHEEHLREDEMCSIQDARLCWMEKVTGGKGAGLANGGVKQ